MSTKSETTGSHENFMGLVNQYFGFASMTIAQRTAVKTQDRVDTYFEGDSTFMKQTSKKRKSDYISFSTPS